MGHVVELAKAGILNWKEYGISKLKTKKDFKITEAKIVSIDMHAVGIRNCYSSLECFHDLLSPGMSYLPLSAGIVPRKSHVSKSKSDDVTKLLTLLGIADDSPVKQFYSSIDVNSQ